MSADQKKEPPQSSKSQPAPPRAEAGKKVRSGWVKKTPAEVVLEQIAKQEKKVNELRETLKQEEATLQKLSRAKAIFETS